LCAVVLGRLPFAALRAADADVVREAVERVEPPAHMLGQVWTLLLGVRPLRVVVHVAAA
jgi:hypothetical protein